RVGVAIHTAGPEFRGLHDETVAVPTAPGVAHVQAERLADVGAFGERNDARLVNHLHADRPPTLSLDELIRVAVDGRQHRVWIPASDAAIVEAQILVGGIH